MDAYTFFVVRNSWLQANFNLDTSKFDVMQQQALINVFENNNLKNTIFFTSTKFNFTVLIFRTVFYFVHLCFKSL
jgi:hypothetical protein